jgi:hypothetical protein
MAAIIKFAIFCQSWEQALWVIPLLHVYIRLTSSMLDLLTTSFQMQLIFIFEVLNWISLTQVFTWMVAWRKSDGDVKTLRLREN